MSTHVRHPVSVSILVRTHASIETRVSDARRGKGRENKNIKTRLRGGNKYVMLYDNDDTRMSTRTRGECERVWWERERLRGGGRKGGAAAAVAATNGVRTAGARKRRGAHRCGGDRPGVAPLPLVGGGLGRGGGGGSGGARPTTTTTPPPPSRRNPSEHRRDTDSLLTTFVPSARAPSSQHHPPTVVFLCAVWDGLLFPRGNYYLLL